MNHPSDAAQQLFCSWMNRFGMKNQTVVDEFILLGFPSILKVRFLVIVGVLMIYILTVTGNIVIVATVVYDPNLHKPMYFFLSNLSFLGIMYVTATIPKFLVNLLTIKKSISLTGCKAQAFSHFFLGATEFFLLTAMAYDRYMAICHPLHYHAIMSSRVCVQLACGSWFGGLMTVLVQTILVFQLPFCGPNTINHFYCDVGPLLKLACTDTHPIEWIVFVVATIVVFSNSLLTVVSYIFIISTVMKIPSISGRQKAFSTCISHLIVVILLYGAIIFIYVRPTGHASLNMNKVVSLLNTLVTPLLNPFIYTLRNKEVKDSLKRGLSWNKVFKKSHK
ncbi:olfactory receptor 6X1-like isoform X1 [Crotalus tigris]|uniref:olfactory receptor 6X1-like isoform X1 n=2 Tax=Crotalus tigris TaxID=88082 RepID=UPI00192F2586|nr:olfactory receptor 6X1-like isoform X1 [Crotalus tigris]XP_039185969.1 olfactory receptor 6X1-like isoform X1 [Crotalus tigris]